MAKNAPIKVGTALVKPGERTTVRLPVADLYTGTSLAMPVHVVCGRRHGPTLFVSAAIHGDELNGVEVIRRLLKRKVLESMRGTLLAVPIVNVHGFLDQSRYLPDRRDLNRSFPGSRKGSVASRMAYTFMHEIVDKSDFGIDLHTGAINRCNLPQVRGNLDDPATLQLAKAFGAPVIIDSNARDGSLRQCAADKGMPMLIYEAGEALRFDELSIRAGLRGTLNAMRHIGMLPLSKKSGTAAPVVADSTSWVRAPESGIVIPKVELGSRVTEGQVLAIMGDPVGDEETPVTAPFDGIVIGHSKLPLAHEGDALFHVAAFKSVSRAENRVEEFAAVHGA
ncbi:MAG TPA: succinylglutamate desuccinylase/aspartoacylase family protein [Woeseiaceae bacterium]|nr:succinylglutamate desuccinylase/aspartoacylase family protein [Woeseiaceae bacterium]